MCNHVRQHLPSSRGKRMPTYHHVHMCKTTFTFTTMNATHTHTGWEPEYSRHLPCGVNRLAIALHRTRYKQVCGGFECQCPIAVCSKHRRSRKTRQHARPTNNKRPRQSSTRQ